MKKNSFLTLGVVFFIVALIAGMGFLYIPVPYEITDISERYCFNPYWVF